MGLIFALFCADIFYTRITWCVPNSPVSKKYLNKNKTSFWRCFFLCHQCVEKSEETQKLFTRNCNYILHKFHCIILNIALRVQSLSYSKNFKVPTLFKSIFTWEESFNTFNTKYVTVILFVFFLQFFRNQVFQIVLFCNSWYVWFKKNYNYFSQQTFRLVTAHII